MHASDARHFDQQGRLTTALGRGFRLVRSPGRNRWFASFRVLSREPLSAIDLVDTFDGKAVTMWEAMHHLRALGALGVLLPYPAGRDRLSHDPAFDLLYRLAPLKAREGGNA